MPSTLMDSDKSDWPSFVFLPPNAQKILRWLGLEAEVNKHAIQIDRHDLVNKLGQPLRVMGPGFHTDLSGLTIQAISGKFLEEIVKQEVEFSLPVHIRSSGIEEIWLNIETRPWIIEPLSATTGNKYTGHWLIEGVANFELPLTMATSITDVWTKKGRLRICPKGNNEIFWQARIPYPGGLPVPEDATSWLKNNFKDTKGVIAAVVNAITQCDSSTSEKVKWTNSGFRHQTIIAGCAKVQLSGESLYSQAIYFEEAFQLGHYLAKSSDWLAALEQYQVKCMPKVKLIYQDDWMTSQLHRSTMGRFLLHALLKILPEKALKQQLNLLYQVKGLDGAY